MIDLYYWPTPNGHKIPLFLEEAGLPYKLHPVNIGKGDQHEAAYLALSPSGKMPAIVDNEPAGGGAPVSLFESGAILLYLAEKTGRFIPSEIHGRAEVLQWLFWQVGGLGPMAGQNGHFKNFAPDAIPYAIDRYSRETARLYGVMDTRLADRAFLAGADYTIADMASYPWVVAHERLKEDLSGFPNLRRWREAIAERPGTKRAYALAEQVNPTPQPTGDEERKILFGQGAK